MFDPLRMQFVCSDPLRPKSWQRAVNTRRHILMTFTRWLSKNNVCQMTENYSELKSFIIFFFQISFILYIYIVLVLGSEIINNLPWVSVLMYRMLFETSNGCCSMSAGLFSSSLGVPRCLDIDGLGSCFGAIQDLWPMISIWYQWYPYDVLSTNEWAARLWVTRYDFTDSCTVNTCGSCGWSTLRTWPYCLKHFLLLWDLFLSTSGLLCSGVGWDGVGMFTFPGTCTHGRCYAGDSAVPFLSFTCRLFFVKYGSDTGRWSFLLYTL